MPGIWKVPNIVAVLWYNYYYCYSTERMCATEECTKSERSKDLFCFDCTLAFLELSKCLLTQIWRDV